MNANIGWIADYKRAFTKAEFVCSLLFEICSRPYDERFHRSFRSVLCSHKDFCVVGSFTATTGRHQADDLTADDERPCLMPLRCLGEIESLQGGQTGISGASAQFLQVGEGPVGL